MKPIIKKVIIQFDEAEFLHSDSVNGQQSSVYSLYKKYNQKLNMVIASDVMDDYMSAYIAILNDNTKEFDELLIELDIIKVNINMNATIAAYDIDIEDYCNNYISIFMKKNILTRIDMIDNFNNLISFYNDETPDNVKNTFDVLNEYDPRKTENEFLYTEEELAILNGSNNDENETFVKVLDETDLDDDNSDFIKECRDKINNLLGARELKSYVNELALMSPMLNNIRESSNYPTEHLLWSINKGHGCTTMLQCLSEYYYASDLYRKILSNYEDDFKFYEKEFVLNKAFFFDMQSEYDNLKSEIAYTKPGLIAIHIESFINDLDNKYLIELLRYCVKLRHDKIFVFIIPFVDEGVLQRVQRRINDIINIRVLKFPPYTDKELTKLAKDKLQGYNISWHKSADLCFRRLLNLERSDGRFYGLDTVEKLATELVLLKTKNASLVKNNAPYNLLVAEDFDEYFKDSELGDNLGFEQLNDLIGLENVKKRIEEIVLSIKAQKTLYENGYEETKPCYHMMFTGNPGTGKTAIARIVGKIFFDNGLLPIGDMLEVTRVDMVAEHIGQTGPKTISVCKSAIGSVLFIDEAYMLGAGNGDRSGQDFGAEALGALVSEMENNRDKFVVIMAGYDDDMEELCKMNPGLKQRIPHRVHFDSYSNEELFKIFCLQLKKNYIYDDEFYNRAKKFFDSLSNKLIQSESFGNARFVRNLVERIRIKALLRQTFDNAKDIAKIELKLVDFENAINDEDIKNIISSKKKAKIGFQKN